MLLVFINNKLVTIDTITPILLEMKEKYGVNSHIVLTGELAWSGIKDNVVIDDAINKFGSLVYLGYGFNNRLIRLFFSIIQIQKLLLFALLGAKIIHFGSLNSGVLNLIFRKFSKNIFFSQSISFEYTGDKYRYSKNIKPTIPVGDSLIVTNNLMPELKLKEVKFKKKYIFGPTRTRKSWLNHSYFNAEYYLEKYHPMVNYKDGFIVIILYTFGKVVWFDDDNTAEKLLRETLKTIHDTFPEKTIMLKPHVVTQIDFLKKIIDTSGCDNIEITYLHPSVLSRFSNVFISNCYSATLADASSLGVPTIEYTNYRDDLLLRTGNKSVSHNFVDYFINKDSSHLKEVLLKIMQNNGGLIDQKILVEKIDTDDSELLKNLQQGKIF